MTYEEFVKKVQELAVFYQKESEKWDNVARAAVDSGKRCEKMDALIFSSFGIAHFLAAAWSAADVLAAYLKEPPTELSIGEKLRKKLNGLN